jgi:hypothetical protein
MLYHDTDGRLLLAREHAELLASEMRRAGRPTPGQARHSSWARLAAGLLGRVGRMRQRRRKSHDSPAYDA